MPARNFPRDAALADHITIQALLLNEFQGCTHIPFSRAVLSVGIHLPTARNQLSLGTFPIRVVRRGRRIFITLPDLIKYAAADDVPARKRGRPTKAEQLAKEGGAL